MIKNKVLFSVLCLLGGLLWFSLMSVDLAQARLGGGRSMGFRGSRSYSPPRTTPKSPAPTKPQPQKAPQDAKQPQPQPGAASPGPQPAAGSFGRGLAGGLAGGLLGGMLGSMLFGGHGHAAGAAAGGGSSFGLLDLVLIGGLLYLGYRLFFRRRQNNLQYSAPVDRGTNPGASAWRESDFPALQMGTESAPDIQTTPGLEYQLDVPRVKEMAQDIFFKLQGAWMRQDAALLRPLMTEELFTGLSHDLEQMKAQGQINRLENIAIRQVEISEAWQEDGKDYVTVGFLANLLDYVVDAQTSRVIAGSDSEPVRFEEYWTFVRPSGNDQPWKLTAIQQA
ncbi:MAG: TIM44-like domain-containing protein [Desulfobacca sp.]|nr:TIM44-like domain-containing protein [Desulfobacca sp.]